MAEIKRLKKGLDIVLSGEAIPQTTMAQDVSSFAIVPDDYPGFKWKLSVKAGDNVVVGSALLHDKNGSGVCLSSPVAGTVVDIVRGERRKIEGVVVKRSDSEQSQIEIVKPSNKDELINLLCKSGLWAMMRQRPYDIIPSPTVAPRNIFITSFDSAPLAPALIEPDMLKYLEYGIEALSELTVGKIYLGAKFGSGISSSIAEVVEFQGPHPAGNVGIQIANIQPVNKGDVVWALDARTVARIGVLIKDLRLDFSTKVALTGPMAENPHHIDTTIGASLSELQIKPINSNQSIRAISGNVLTGKKVNIDNDWIRYPYRQVTMIAEGDNADEFMGWASLSTEKYSVKRSFPAFLKGLTKPFNFDARIKGGHRAMILSGEYDKVFPMDIYPEYLIKAILAFDIDKMEQLGIYEVAPEDFALPEFVDTSKLELQKIVREGLDKLYAELG